MCFFWKWTRDTENFHLAQEILRYGNIHLAQELLHLHLQLLLLVAGDKMQLKIVINLWEKLQNCQDSQNMKEGHWVKAVCGIGLRISVTFSVTPSMENLDGGSKQTLVSANATTALSFSPHCKIMTPWSKMNVKQSCKNVPTVPTSRCYFFWPVLIFGKNIWNILRNLNWSPQQCLYQVRRGES